MTEKYGFKGFRKDFTCNKFQYKEGDIYDMPKEEINLCKKGFHFCWKMEDVFRFYSKSIYQNNIFAVVQPLGKIINGTNKSVTNKIKIVKVLTLDQIKKITDKQKHKNVDNDVFCLDVVRKLQKKYEMSIGGSVALRLHGVDLERDEVDFDVVMPYYQKFNFEDDDLIDEVEEFDGKTSGNDFCRTFVLTTIDGRFLKIDVRINPEQSYEIIKYKEKSYKVSDLMTILEAKCRYAMEGNSKHKDDIISLLTIIPNTDKKEEEFNLLKFLEIKENE